MSFPRQGVRGHGFLRRGFRARGDERQIRATAQRRRFGRPSWRNLGLCLALVLPVGAVVVPPVSGSTPTTPSASQTGVTPLAPICPTVIETAGLPVAACFPPLNGNQSQEASGTGEIPGASLNGPTVLTAGKCSYPNAALNADLWCTPNFHVSISVPGSGGAKYFSGWTLLGSVSLGTTVTTNSTCGKNCGQETLRIINPAAGDQWCNYQERSCPTTSPPLMISGRRGVFSTLRLCVAGTDSITYADNSQGSFTACEQLQIQYGPVRSNPTPRKSPLITSIDYLQNGNPVVLTAKGRSPQQDTLQLADDDKGEIAQEVTVRVTVRNSSKKTLTNVSINGRPSFSYADAANVRQVLPIGITSGPKPNAVIGTGTLAPGGTATLTYRALVTNNGLFDCSAQVLAAQQSNKPLLETLGLAEVTHEARNNRMRVLA